MSARKRGRGWDAYWYERDGQGRRRQRSRAGFATKREAERFSREQSYRISAGTYVEPSRQVFGDYLDEWLDASKPSLRPSTHASYRMLIEDFIKPRIGGVPLQALTASRLNALYAELRASGLRRKEGGLSARTVRYCAAVVNMALTDAVEQQLVVRNVAKAAKPPKKASPPMKAWRREELRAFLAHVQDDRLASAYMLAATTGMRRGEILGLRWRDLDLEGGRLVVRQTLISVNYEAQFSEPKTKQARRQILLDPATTTALSQHKQRQLDEMLIAETLWANENDLVFTRADGSPIHPQSFTEAFKRRAKEAGLPPLSLHGLRHTYATLALQAGVHPKVVSERLGHASVAFTLDTYTDSVPVLHETAAELVAALIFAD